MEDDALVVLRVGVPPVPSAVDTYGFYVTATHPSHLGPSPADHAIAATSEARWRDDAAEERWWLLSFGLHARLRGELPGQRLAAARLQQQWRQRLCDCPTGPAPPLRRLLWGYWSGALQGGAAAQAATRAAYWRVAAGAPAEMEDGIRRDVGRTLPLHCLFRAPDGAGQRSLARLLHALSVADPTVGYCQGMAFVAAGMLLHLPEDESYGVLRGLWEGPHQLRELYRPHFPLLRQLHEALRRLLRALLPALHAHFTLHRIDVSVFAAKWFLTLFTYEFAPPLLARVWDLFLLEGPRALLRAAVAVLRAEMSALLTMDLEGALLHLKSRQLRGNEDAPDGDGGGKNVQNSFFDSIVAVPLVDGGEDLLSSCFGGR